jgi:hypothetical protein
VHQPKVKFLMLARNARLAALTTRYDAVTTRLSVEQDRVEIAAGELATEAGRATIERFFDRLRRGDARTRARPRLAEWIPVYRFACGLRVLDQSCERGRAFGQSTERASSIALSRQYLRRGIAALEGICACRTEAPRRLA